MSNAKKGRCCTQQHGQFHATNLQNIINRDEDLVEFFYILGDSCDDILRMRKETNRYWCWRDKSARGMNESEEIVRADLHTFCCFVCGLSMVEDIQEQGV
jgi:hypothetical protein